MGNEVIFIVSVIALIFYLVISKFLKNNIKDNYFRIFIGLIISIMFGIIFYVFSVAGLIYFLTKEKSRDFDKKDWILLNEDIEKRLHRYEMIDDLIDSRVDIYSTCLVAYEMLTGKNPYYEDGDNLPQIMRKIEKGEYKLLDDDTYQNINEFIQTCINRYPTRRPESAQDALEWFEYITN